MKGSRKGHWGAGHPQITHQNTKMCSWMLASMCSQSGSPNLLAAPGSSRSVESPRWSRLLWPKPPVPLGAQLAFSCPSAHREDSAQISSSAPSLPPPHLLHRADVSSILPASPLQAANVTHLRTHVCLPFQTGSCLRAGTGPFSSSSPVPGMQWWSLNK